MKNDPFSKLGALDQKLYEKPTLSPIPTTQEEKKPDANVHTRTHARIDTSTLHALVESLHRKLQHKQHLASYTFRFRSEELEDLTKVHMKLDKTHPKRVSKNDLVRLGVNWLLEDYEQNGEKSMLACILARI